MEPVDALQEIAFLLERERASAFKAKAFRRAADAIRTVRRATLDDPAALRAIDGIGDTTADVILEAHRGDVPLYLADLRERLTGDAPTSALRALLKGDLHAHTEWSDGSTSIQAMVDGARRLGHEYLAITDHSPRLTIAHGLTADRLRTQLTAEKDVDTGAPGDPGSLRLLSGIEVDIHLDGSLDQTPELLGRLDIVVASVHSKLAMPATEMTERMLTAVADPHIDVLGHATGRLVAGSRGTRPPSRFDATRVFAECATRGVAVEINARPEREDPPDDLIRIALDAGCLFSIDSDAHAPGQLGLLDFGAARAERLGVPADRIVTTWPVERLLEWTRRDR